MWDSIALPPVVSRMPACPRSKTATPASSSNRLTRRLIVDALILGALAACVKLPAAAEAYLAQNHQASRMVGNWNAVKSLWASGCMNAMKVAIPSLSSDRSCSECAFQRPSAPRV